MSKFALKSLTIQGGLVLGIAYVLSQFGVEVEQAQIEKFLENSLAVVGFIMLVVGRWRARHELHVKK